MNYIIYTSWQKKQLIHRLTYHYFITLSKATLTPCCIGGFSTVAFKLTALLYYTVKNCAREAI
jgi:hypothetical protein